MACRTGWLFNGGASSFMFMGEPVTAGIKTIQKARSNSGALIYCVTEPQSDGVSRTRWVYPSDRDYVDIEKEYGRQQEEHDRYCLMEQ